MYKFILSMTEDALQNDVNDKLFSDNNKLTTDEIEYLSNNNPEDAGRFILITAARNRISGRIDSGRRIPRDEFNVPADKITEIAQLWGKPD